MTQKTPALSCVRFPGCGGRNIGKSKPPPSKPKKKVLADAKTFFLVAGAGFEPATLWL